MRVLVLFIILFSSSSFFAQKNAIDKVNGVAKYEFGMSVSECGLSEENKDKHTPNYYNLFKPDMNIGGFKVWNIGFKFHNNKLIKIKIEFSGLNYEQNIKIREGLKEKYGAITQTYKSERNGEEVVRWYSWIGNKNHVYFYPIYPDSKPGVNLTTISYETTVEVESYGF